MAADRDGIVEVAMPARAAIRRSFDAGITGRERRLFDAIIAETTTWTRLTDRISTKYLYAQAKLDRTHGRRAMRRLAADRVIRYEPGRGRGNYSLIGLWPADEKAVAGDRLLAEEKGAEKGATLDIKGGRNGSEKGAARGSPTEEDREETLTDSFSLHREREKESSVEETSYVEILRGRLEREPSPLIAAQLAAAEAQLMRPSSDEVPDDHVLRLQRMLRDLVRPGG